MIKHPADGLMLAASHLIGPESYQADEVAAFLAGILVARYPAQLRTRYGFDSQGMDGDDLIAARRPRVGLTADNAAPHQENDMPKGQQRSNREKKKPKKQPAPAAPRAPGLPREPWKK